MARMESPRDKTSTVSAQLSGQRLERLEDYIENHDVAKSEIIRRGIDAIVATDIDQDDGRVPPADDDLATAYEALRRLTSGGDQWIRQERACAHLSQRVNDYNKDTVYGGLLRPLDDLGYIDLAADAQGQSASVFVYP
jgi:hypothetical protein